MAYNHMTHPLTIDPLPPNHQSCESNEKEDAAHHRLPFVGAMVHLCEGFMELEPVHWRQAVCGWDSWVSIPRTLEPAIGP